MTERTAVQERTTNEVQFLLLGAALGAFAVIAVAGVAVLGWLLPGPKLSIDAAWDLHGFITAGGVLAGTVWITTGLLWLMNRVAARS